jgi:hypothetical protein
MNLLQIQDQLKSLPNDPRTMQALTAYANGANPAVPPYLALGELNRRKQLIEKAQMQQASQPPQGTVKDQVEQQAGIMALQTGRQQQAMQNAMRMGSAMPQAAPANIPQPEAQAEVQAAGGGLMSLLADKAKAKRMNSGGIVALAPAGSVDEAVEEAEDEDTEDAKEVPPKTPTDARRLFAALQQEATLRRASQKAPTYTSPIEAEMALMKKYPERFAALAKEPGADALNRLDEMQTARRAELAKQREEAAASRPGILQLLGQAALESRGQQGGSALASILGGYSKLQTGAEADALKQEQGLRMRELELQDVRRQAVDKIDEIKRAKAEGDLNREMKAKQDFAKLLKDHNVSINTLLGKQLTSAATLGGAERSAEAREFGAKEATKRAGIVKPGEKERIMAKIADLRAKGKDEEADAMVQSYNSLSGSSAAVGGINAQRAILNAQLREVNRTLDPKNIDATDDEKAEAKAERDRILADLKALQAPGTQKPPKPTGGITPEEFNARWAQLAPGESLVGPDGKKYTKAPKNK